MSALVKVVSGLVAAGLLAASMWLYNFKPHLEGKMQGPLTSRGRVGAVVGNRVFSVKVSRVDVATALVRRSAFESPKVMPSPGIFVIVYLDIKSNQKPFQAGHVRLATRGGLSYGETGRTGVLDSSPDHEPMLWSPASYIFEIPKDRLAGARLIVGESALMNQLTAETDVDLGIDGGKAAQLISRAPRGYVLKTT